jgi:hypothetical protein
MLVLLSDKAMRDWPTPLRAKMQAADAELWPAFVAGTARFGTSDLVILVIAMEEDEIPEVIAAPRLQFLENVKSNDGLRDENFIERFASPAPAGHLWLAVVSTWGNCVVTMAIVGAKPGAA